MTRERERRVRPSRKGEFRRAGTNAVFLLSNLKVNVLEIAMPGTGSMVPYGADQTIYLVVDRMGRQGAVYCEVEIERTDPDTIVADLLAGLFSDPVRVTAFNTLEHWSQDISWDIAAEIQTRCDIDGAAVPGHIEDFVHDHAGPVSQHPSVRRHSDAMMTRSN